jgi:hypothetical protein
VKRYAKPVLILGFLVLSLIFVFQPGLSYSRLDWRMFLANYVDNVPPADITDLAAVASANEGEVDLSWTAPGDDGNVGTARNYLIRYNTVAITESNWLSSTLVIHMLLPSPAGTPETLTITDLTPGVTYYFAIKSQDEVPNTSGVSNSPSAVPVAVPPETITDLAASSGSNEGEVDLEWTAPYDNSATTAYFIRYNTVAITESNWLSSTLVSHSLTPSAPGVSDTLTITGLVPGEVYFFGIKTQDDIPSESEVSNSPSAVARAIPPDAITDLAASSGSAEGEVDLNWTAPGDDGDQGTASTYLIRYNTVAITESNWLSSTLLVHSLAPSPAGINETLTISDLTPGQTYFFAIKTQDEVPNTSGVSNSPSAVARSIPPDAITDLAASSSVEAVVDLSWTAPGDDGDQGTASTYLIRYNTVEIDESNWLSSTLLAHSLTPGIAGSSETLSTTLLTPGMTYYFAIKTQDEVPNTSGVSNSPSVTVLSIPPDAISDLAASSSVEAVVDLSWTAPGDDGTVGTASAYLIRYNTVEISESNWLSSTLLAHSLTPSPAGTTETLTITTLMPGETYFFAIKSQDDISNVSDISNSPSVTVLSIPPAAISDLAASSSAEGVVDLSWTAPGDDGTVGTASAYFMRYNTVAITESNWLSSTLLSHGLTPSLAGISETLTITTLTPGETCFFAIKSQDDISNVSDVSNSPGVTVLSIPPAAITDLAANPGSAEGEVVLSWTAPGDDGNVGTASTYLIRYNTILISEINWESSIVVSHGLTPSPAGTSETLTITLTPGTTYYFAIKTQDEIPNTSGISNSPSVSAYTDDVPPAAITDLAASSGAAEGEVDLSWTAPGDDGNVGTATTYLIRYNTVEITETNWDTSTVISHSLAPSLAGSSESLTVSGLTPGGTYYFAIKTQDEIPNTSDVSNSPSVVAYTDDDPPAAIADLSATAGDEPGEVILQWTATGDDGNVGTATAYVARYYTQTISSEGVWDAAYDLTGEPVPLIAGTVQSMTVALTPGQVFHFAIKVQDEVPNISDLSNSPTVTAPPVLLYLPLTIRQGP